MKPGSVLILLAVSLTSAAAPVAGQQFRFDPPDGTTYVETLKVTQQYDLSWLGSHSETSETSSRVRLTRTSEGYTAAATLLTVRMTEDGKELETPFLVLPIGKTFTYDIDAIGRIKAIRGLNELVAELDAAAPLEDEDESFVSILSDDNAVAGETDGWHSRIGHLVGRSFKVGGTWTTTEQRDLPMGRKLRFTTTTRVVGSEKRNGRDCVRLRFTSTSAPRPVRKAKTASGRRKASAGGGSASGVSLWETGERVIDPKTMLIYAESSTRTIRLKIDVEGEENVPTTVTEKRQYQYRYE